ncbi:MAG: DUF4405 domain-containing protein, partial [Terrimicrobiaceae bacterium]
MKRTPLNLLIDLLAALGVLGMLLTGYILRFPLPPTTNRTHDLWGLSRHEWGTIHSWASLGLLAVLFVHLVLHWDWIYSTIRHRFTSAASPPHQRLRAGLLTMGAFLVLMGAFAWSTQACVRELKTPRHPLRESPTASAPVPVVSPPQAIDFWREVMPIFQTSCVGCHGPKKQRAGFRADQRQDFFKPGDEEPLIVPGDAEKSRLIAIVSGEVTDMKDADAHRLLPEEIRVLKAWINSGADWPPKASSNHSADEET